MITSVSFVDFFMTKQVRFLLSGRAGKITKKNKQIQAILNTGL